MSYLDLPRPVTDVGDGATGAAGRGFADPFNMLDELGGVADTLGIGMAPDGERETIWNSDRRFGDILWNNIDQNRSILAYDDQEHPIARFGGQIASGVVLPYGAGARTIPQLARLGAVEGFAAGFGAGEGGVGQRLPSAAIGGGLGFAGGAALGGTFNAVGAGWRAGRRALGRVGEDAPPGPVGYEAAPVVDDAMQQVGPAPAVMSEPQGGVMASQGDGPASGCPIILSFDTIRTNGELT